MNGCIYVEDFMLFERAAGKAAATLRNHERALRRLSGWLVAQGRPEEEVTRSDLVAFVNSLVGHRNPDYINQYVSAMRVYFRWLHEEGLITADPAARLKFLAVPVRPVESLTEAECKKLVKWATTEAPRKRFGVHRTGVLSLLLLDTGMRIGEALRLTVADLDLTEGKLLVRSTKTGDFRVVPMSITLRKHLRRYLLRRGKQLIGRGVESQYLFISESGAPCDVALMEHSFPYIGKAAGIRRVHPHLLRHTFATRCLLNGAPMPAVMRLGGWKKLSTVQRYTYMNDEVAARVHAQTSPLPNL
jgi:site-specific recombinase XerD